MKESLRHQKEESIGLSNVGYSRTEIPEVLHKCSNCTCYPFDLVLMGQKGNQFFFCARDARNWSLSENNRNEVFKSDRALSFFRGSNLSVVPEGENIVVVVLGGFWSEGNMTGTAALVTEQVTPQVKGQNVNPQPQVVSGADLRDVEQALQETREQRELRIRQLFERFDTAKTGYLDHGVIEDGFQSFGIRAHHKHAADLLRVCDSNRDGKVDFGEFRKYMDDKELELYQMFRDIDANFNGVLQHEELRDALNRVGIKVSDEELQSFVDHIDQDNNGVISFSEWRDFLLLFPHEVTIESVYRYWEKVCFVDIGEQAVIPEGISRHLDAYKYLLAGGIAGAVSRTATAPLDRLKVLLQVQIEAPTRKGVIGGLSHMYTEGGVLAFFRGNGINVLKVAPEQAIKFYAFELLKDYVVGTDNNGKKNDIGPFGRLIAGGCAGAVAQTVIYPMDLVKTRLQTFACEGGKPPSLTSLSRDVWIREGPRGFYRGLVPSLLGMVPYAGIDLAAYETLRDWTSHVVGKDNDPGRFIQLGCGTVSGALGATCVYPLQLVRTRMQAQCPRSQVQYTGMFDVFQKTYKIEGLKGFYKDWGSRQSWRF
ncbi:hypothetical protein R1flu_010733 [Riccia fluitans]|uniref:EF-hand domain-containing protein n=1 Tax=Riccia fluitans TaxID=41844 RepID=A0ABD1Z5T5_9MARC